MWMRQASAKMSHLMSKSEHIAAARTGTATPRRQAAPAVGALGRIRSDGVFRST